MRKLQYSLYEEQKVPPKTISPTASFNMDGKFKIYDTLLKVKNLNMFSMRSGFSRFSGI